MKQVLVPLGGLLGLVAGGMVIWKLILPLTQTLHRQRPNCCPY